MIRTPTPVCVCVSLTTLTNCEMETSNSTVTGSETFSTGLMNWLYLLNSFLKSRSSALDEQQSGGTETARRQRERGADGEVSDWTRGREEEERIDTEKRKRC